MHTRSVFISTKKKNVKFYPLDKAVEIFDVATMGRGRGGVFTGGNKTRTEHDDTLKR